MVLKKECAFSCGITVLSVSVILLVKITYLNCRPSTLWRLAAFGDFWKKKTTETHVALHGNFSRLVSATGLVKASKDAASLLVCTQKNIFGWGCGFFVSYVISGRLLVHLGPLYLALGANCYMVVFCWSFYWKLGYNPSFLILWMTCWSFRIKSYDLK